MMDVNLVSITTSLLKKEMTPEEYMVYIARVSNPSNQMNVETAPRLLNYLIKHKHWSPFEFVDMTVEIKTRRSIAAQILRHKSFSFQEFSQRYSSATSFEAIELRKQAEKNRQSSTETFDPELSESKISNYKNSGHIKASSAISEFLEASMRLYAELIDAGIAREVARDILPLATETTLYMKGSVRSWIHYLELRCLDDTQKEHRDIANNIKAIFIDNFPNIAEALEWKKK